MAYRDSGRYKKTYSFYRAIPVLQATDGDITSVIGGTGIRVTSPGGGSGQTGDVTVSINDSVVATISGSTFTGVTTHSAGLSGSLTRLPDGTSYIKAGSNITVTSASNGAVTIASTGGSPGGSDTHVQFNDGGVFGGDSGLVYNKNTDTLTGVNVVLTGDLTVNGTTTTVNTTNLEVKDAVIGLGFASGTIQQSAGDRGWIGGLAGVNNVAAFWDDSTSEFAFARTTNSATASLPISIASYSNVRAANIQGSIITASLGFSGSLTKLTNGTSYLIAGSGISITTGSNGAVTITNDGTVGDITGVTAGTGLTGGGTSGIVTLNINDSVVATVSGTTFTGATKHNSGLSGSLTKLTDGTSYLVAGSNITISSASNGSVTISSVGGGGTPGGSDTQIQYNSGGSFAASSNFTFASNTIYLTGSVSQGNVTLAAGLNSHAEGNSTETNGQYAHAEGYDTLANGNYSHAEGYGTTVSGNAAHCEGLATNASGDHSHAEGRESTASATGAHAEGRGTTASAQYAHTEGYITTAYGNYSHAEGGPTTTTYGTYSHAEGFGTETNGSHSHAEGDMTRTWGVGSHAEGFSTSASSDWSHAEGYYTVASGTYSHAGGLYTIASGSGQTVIGKYNKRDNTSSLFVIGNGTGDSNASRSDIFLVDDTTAVVSGTLKATQGLSGSLTKLTDGTTYLIAGSGISISTGSNGAVTIETSGLVLQTLPITSVLPGVGLLGGGDAGPVTLDIDDSVVATISGSTFTGATKHNAGLSGSLTKLTDGTSYLIAGSNITITSASNGSVTISSAGGGGSPGGSDTHIQYNSGGTFAGSSNFTFASNTVHLTGSLQNGDSSKAIGSYSHAEGYSTSAEADYSHSEGIMTHAYAVGSHSEGSSAIANSVYSHAEGAGTTTSAAYAHAEGYYTVASGMAAHAEGYNTVASGETAHAEGYYTKAKGDSSHTAGVYTVASGSGQNVVGRYNRHGNTDSLFIVGNGTGDNEALRSDILLINSSSILLGSGNINPDVFLFVSGTIGQNNNGKSLFGGDVTVSGTLKSTQGLSGSLTKLTDGTSYLIAGLNMTLTTGSNGAVTFASSQDTSVNSVSASQMDLANGARYFTKTASGALSWTFANVPATGAVVVVLELTNGGTGTQTWPAAVKWPGGTAPTLTASGVDVLSFVTDDGGTIWRGVTLMTDSK